MAIEPGDLKLVEFNSYMDYVKSFVTKSDLRFLQNERLERFIVKLGYRSALHIYTESEFWERRAHAIGIISGKMITTSILSDPLRSTDAVLRAFEEREMLNTQKKIATIVYLRNRSHDGFEKWAYIDLSQSFTDFRSRKLNSSNWIDIYRSHRKLVPRREDLSYHDVKNKVVSYTDSMNFKVIHNKIYGLMFMHRDDHKMVPLGPNPPIYGENVKRSYVKSDRYGTVVFYDHKVRSKS